VEKYPFSQNASKRDASSAFVKSISRGFCHVFGSHHYLKNDVLWYTSVDLILFIVITSWQSQCEDLGSIKFSEFAKFWEFIVYLSNFQIF